jgi:hypothetical protein
MSLQAKKNVKKKIGKPIMIAPTPSLSWMLVPTTVVRCAIDLRPAKLVLTHWKVYSICKVTVYILCMSTKI